MLLAKYSLKYLRVCRGDNFINYAGELGIFKSVFLKRRLKFMGGKQKAFQPTFFVLAKSRKQMARTFCVLNNVRIVEQTHKYYDMKEIREACFSKVT